VASALALIVGQGSINVFAAGVFLKPMSQALGFGRGEISTAIGISNLMVAFSTPFFGAAIDRYGVRRPLAIAIVLFALTTAALGLAPRSILGVYALFALTGIMSAGQSPNAYSKVVSAWFDRRRGFALGIALAGVGVGTAIIPQISQYLIRTFGWRVGFVGLGGRILLLAWIPVVLVVREPAEPRAAAPGASAPPDLLQGLTLPQARGDLRFWAILSAFFFATLSINGTLVHVVPMLTDRGIPVATAVAAISSSGVALIVGRLIAGWIIDRAFAPYVAIFFLVCPIAGLLILGFEPANVSPFVGAILLGVGIGAEVDLLSYLVSRYFGIAHFGAIYGVMFTGVVLGNAAGATILGWTYQIGHSYLPALVGYCILLGLACILLARLGPYKYPPRPRESEASNVARYAH
jgi:MFS family permease